MKWGCRGRWGHWGCWGCRGHWGCKGSKAWKITTDDCRVIQVPWFSFILMFWKQFFFVRILEYQVELWHFLCWRLLRPANGTFLKTGSKERVPDISNNLDFWWSLPQKEAGFDHLGAGESLAISISLFFWWNWGCRGRWWHWGCWGCRGHWGCKGSKA